MKTALFFFSLLLLTSCVTPSFQQRKHLEGRYKAPKDNLKVSSTPDETVVIKLSETEDDKYNSVAIQANPSTPEKEITSKEIKTQEETVISLTKENRSVEPYFTSKTIQELENEAEFDDTVYINPTSYEGSIAREAKTDGTISLVLGILALIPFVPFGFWIGIGGIVLGTQSLDAKYNTAEGEKRARIGRTLSIIAVALRLIVIIALILFFIALF